MQIRCPHCHVVIELVDEVVGRDATCPKCGSRIERALAIERALPSTLKLSPEAKLAEQPPTPAVPTTDQPAGQAQGTPKQQMCGRSSGRGSTRRASDGHRASRLEAGQHPAGQ